ncbi:hypothetical protein TNCT_647881 [Trichonephila clavata]|uniref:Uncharacterized protein n=1 Tax=Trichonephila clavata TaxID=2740835 RepID=A0A8X6HL17_TRICU|nr:hypothetical protein TNCT_647881 [Trichonephila clavata]
MDRKKREENSETKNPEEQITEVISNAIKELSTNITLRDHFVSSYNNLYRTLRSNINALSLIREFPSLISPSQFQRFITTTFVFICFLESIRNYNLTCCFTGIFICFMLIITSFITTVITLALAPGKSLYSNLFWISQVNFLNEVINHKIKDAQTLFQITVNTDSLDVISRRTFNLVSQTWKSFLTMTLKYYISCFNVYGIIFAVQFCVVLKCTNFREISEFLECFSYIILIVLAVTRDRKIKKYRKEIRDKTFNLNSSIENFFKWFQLDSEVKVLLEKCEFIKSDVLKLLNPDDNSLNNTLPQSSLMFAVVAINVSHKLQYCMNLDSFKDIIRYIFFNKHWYAYQKEEMEELNTSSSSYNEKGLISKIKKMYKIGKLLITQRKPAVVHTEHIKSELRSSKTLREISLASEEASISEIHYSEMNSYSSLESSSYSERESEFSEGERFSSTESELYENNLYNNRNKNSNENLKNVTEVINLYCTLPAQIFRSENRKEGEENPPREENKEHSRNENEENENVSEDAYLEKNETDLSRKNTTNKDFAAEGKNLDHNVKGKIISEIDHQNNEIRNFPYDEISDTDSQVEGTGPPCDELLNISDYSVLSSSVSKNSYNEDNTRNRVNNKAEVTLNKAKETRSTENVENVCEGEKITKTREFTERNNSNSKNTEISTKAIEAHGKIISKSRTEFLKCCSKTFDDLILEPRTVFKNARKCISLINLHLAENNDFKPKTNHEEMISQWVSINNSVKKLKIKQNTANKLEKNLDDTHFAPFPSHSDNSNESENAAKCPLYIKTKDEINAKLNQLRSLEYVAENQSFQKETLKYNNNSMHDKRNSVSNISLKMSEGNVQDTRKSDEQLDTNYCNEDTNDSLKADPSKVKIKDTNPETMNSAQNLSSPQELRVTSSTKAKKHPNSDLKPNEEAELLGSGSQSNKKTENKTYSKFVDSENNTQTEEDIYKIVHDFFKSTLELTDLIVNNAEKNPENDIAYVNQPKSTKGSTNIEDIKKSIHENSHSKLSSKISIDLGQKHLENKHSEEDTSRIVQDFLINYVKNTLVLSDPVANNPENGVSDDVTLLKTLKDSVNADETKKIMNENFFTWKHENKDKNLVLHLKSDTNTSSKTSSISNTENTSVNHSSKIDSGSPDILDDTNSSKDNNTETPKTFRKIRKSKRMLKRPANLLSEEISESNGLKNSTLFSTSNEEASENGEKTKGNSLEETSIPLMVGNDTFNQTNLQIANSLRGRINDQESVNNVEFPFKSDPLFSFSLELNSNKGPVEKNDGIPLANLIKTLSIDPSTSIEQNDNASNDKNLQNCYNNKSNIFWMSTLNKGSKDKECYKPLSSNKEFESETLSADSNAYANSVGQIYSKEVFNKHDVLETNKATSNTSTEATVKPHFNTPVSYRNIKTRLKSEMFKKNISKDKKKKKQNPKNIQENFPDSQDNTQKQYESHVLMERREKSSHSDEKSNPPANEISPLTTKNSDKTMLKFNSYIFGKQDHEGSFRNFTEMGKNEILHQENQTQTCFPQINMFSKENCDTDKLAMKKNEKGSPPANELSPFATKSSDKTVQKLNSYTFGKPVLEGSFNNFTVIGKNQTVQQEKTQTDSPQINKFSKENSDAEKLVMEKNEKVSPRQHGLSPFTAKSLDKTMQKLISYTFGWQAPERTFPDFKEIGENQVVLQENKTQTGSTQINIFSKENCNTEKLEIDKDEKVNLRQHELSPFTAKSSEKTVQKLNSFICGKQASEGSFPNFTAMGKNKAVQEKTQIGSTQINMFSKENCDTDKLVMKKAEKASPPESKLSPFATKSSDKTVQKFNSYIFGEQVPGGSFSNFTAIGKNNQIAQKENKPLSSAAQVVLGNQVFEVKDSWFNPNKISKEKYKTKGLSSSNFSELNQIDGINGQENEAPKGFRKILLATVRSQLRVCVT